MKKLVAAAVLALAVATIAPVASAEPVRILIAVSSKQGLAVEQPLKFADNDATRVRDVLTSLGGVKPENATYLSEPSRAALYAALDKAKGEAQKHSSDEVTLLFYFSGHGDHDAIHLGGDRVLISEVTQKLGEIPAGLRIAVTDACRSTRTKGFATDEPFAISTAVLPQAAGQVWLHASSDGEAAQESDEIQGAIFTNAWLSGLRGAADSNGDARVTLDESFAFAHAQTLIRSSKSSGVVQKPEAVFNLREAAPVVITQTAPRMATLALPAAKDTYFLVYTANGKSVLSELWSTPNRPLLLSVPPGRYTVQRRFGGTGAIATIAVGAGEERRVEERDFATSALEPIAAKGGDADRVTPIYDAPRPHEVSAGWVAGGDARSGLVDGPRLGYGYAWSRRFALTAGAELTFENRELAKNHESLTTGFGRAGVEVRQPLGSFLFRAGAGARAGLVDQRVSPHAGNIERASSNAAFTLGPELALGLRTFFGRIVFADLSATGAVGVLRQESQAEAIPSLVGAFTLGARL